MICSKQIHYTRVETTNCCLCEKRILLSLFQNSLQTWTWARFLRLGSLAFWLSALPRQALLQVTQDSSQHRPGWWHILRQVHTVATPLTLWAGWNHSSVFLQTGTNTEELKQMVAREGWRWCVQEQKPVLTENRSWKSNVYRQTL